MISPGSRSGVNWMRLKSSPNATAKLWAVKRLGQAGKVFQQNMAVGQNGGHDLAQQRLLADDDLFDLGDHFAGSLGDVFQ